MTDFGGASYDLSNVTITGNTANKAGAIDASSIGLLRASLILGNFAPTDPDTVANLSILGFDGGNIIGSKLSINGTVNTTKTVSVTDVFAVTKDYDPGAGIVLGGVAALNGAFVPSVALKADATNPAFDRSAVESVALDVRKVTSTDLLNIGNSGPPGVGPIRDLGSYEFVDVKPFIDATALFSTIAENVSTATAIKFATLTILDPDGNNTLSLSGADAALFEIQSDGIYLKAGTILDFETNPVLDVTLDFATIGHGTLSGGASFDVTDANDVPTLNNNTGLTMPEGGTSVITSSKLGYSDVEQSDAQLVYTIMSQTAGTVLKSNVVLSTGQSFTQADINGGLIDFRHDGSEGASAGFGFALSDGTAAIISSFAITVTPVNDAPTAVSLTNVVSNLDELPSFTSARIKIADIDVTDDDLGSETLAVTGADNSFFEIDNGVLYFRQGLPLDFEFKNSFSVAVTVDDPTLPGIELTSGPITLTLNDVNEGPSVITINPSAVGLVENTSTATRIKISDITVNDDALGTNTLTLRGPDLSLFELFNGDVYLKAGVTLDFERQSTLIVGVTVEDTTLPGSALNSAEILVQLTDVNEAPTAVAAANAITSLSENASTAVPRKVSDIIVTDDALGTETIALSGADASQFEVIAGALYLKAGTVLDFESKKTYAVTVNVDDPTIGAAPDATTNFTLSITDANDAPTALTFSNTLASIAENASTAARRKVADITFTDDALGTETITLSGADASKFEIFGGDLYLKAGATLDFETNPKLDVTVNVDDTALGSGIELSRALSVTVTDALETLTGGTANPDTLTGTTGADRISGLGGNDTINGGGGDDIIQGDAGVDKLTGGAGRDTFVFKSITESGYRSSGSLTEKGPLTDQAAIGQRDIITDFTPGTDKIDLSAIDANTILSGNQAFTFRGTGALSSAGSLVYRKFDNAGTANDRTIIFADVTGDGRSDFQIELKGLKTLTAGDFVL